MLDPLFFFISRLNNACSPLVIYLQINQLIGIKDIQKFSALEIQKKSGSSINPAIHHSKVPSSDFQMKFIQLLTSLHHLIENAIFIIPY